MKNTEFPSKRLSHAKKSVNPSKTENDSCTNEPFAVSQKLNFYIGQPLSPSHLKPNTLNNVNVHLMDPNVTIFTTSTSQTQSNSQIVRQLGKKVERATMPNEQLSNSPTIRWPLLTLEILLKRP